MIHTSFLASQLNLLQAKLCIVALRCYATELSKGPREPSKCVRIVNGMYTSRAKVNVVYILSDVILAKKNVVFVCHTKIYF